MPNLALPTALPLCLVLCCACSGGGSFGGQASGAGAGNGTGGASASAGATSSSGGASSGGASAGGAQANGGAATGNAGASGGGATQSGGNGGASSAAWRPYSDTSPWNTPIASGASVDPDSQTMIDDFAVSSQWPFVGINISGFSVPLYWADSTTATQPVAADLGGEGWQGNQGANATAMVPIPDGAAPDPQSDAHMLIIDRAANTEWGFFGAKHSTTWTCTLCATSDLSGDGVRPPDKTNPTWWTSHGPRACGFSLVAGLIRVEEMQAGEIRHALVIAYPHIRAGFYTPPASTSQAANGAGALSTRGIPCGGQIQLDPSLDLDSLGLTASGKIIARALQTYGAFVGDYSGAMSLYAENSPAAQAIWSAGLLQTYEVKDQLMLSSFRVLELGMVYDGGNG